MRALTTLATSALGAVAFAGDALSGMKADPLTSGASASGSGGVGFMALVQMVVALAIVQVVVKYALPKFASTFNKRLATGTGSSIKVEESAAFAGGNLYVVSVRGKDLLLSASASGVVCLADLTEGPTQSEPLGFDEMLEAAHAVPVTRAVVEVPVQEQPAEEVSSGDRIADALKRLERLAG